MRRGRRRRDRPQFLSRARRAASTSETARAIVAAVAGRALTRRRVRRCRPRRRSRACSARPASPACSSTATSRRSCSRRFLPHAFKAIRVRDAELDRARARVRRRAHPARRLRARSGRRHRRDVPLGARRRARPRSAASRSPAGSCPTTSRRRSRRCSPFCVDVASGVESAGCAAAQGSRRACALSSRAAKGLPNPARVPIATAGAVMSKLPSTYGPFGGRFVAETLMPALESSSAAFEAARHDPAFEAAAPAAARRLRRPADAAVLRRAPVRATVGVLGLAQARRPVPHRRAQDEQRARPGPARASAWASRA